MIDFTVYYQRDNDLHNHAEVVIKEMVIYTTIQRW